MRGTEGTRASSSESPTDRSVAVTVVTEVAERRGVDPLSLPPLSDAIDGERLDALLASAADVEVQFEYDGTTVRVTGQTDVELDPVD